MSIAELKRRDALNVVQPWTLVDDAASATGLADPVSDAGMRARTPNLVGAFAYDAKASGTIAVPTGARVLSIAAHCTTAGLLTVAGGASIPIPALTGYTETPYGQLVGPVNVIGSGTDSLYVSWVV